MKKVLLPCKLLILTLLLSITAMGQYTGSFPDVANSKSVLASDSVAGFEPANAVDGSLASYASIPGDAPAWIQIDLGAFYKIDGFGMILPNADELPSSLSFQAGPFGTWWSTLREVTITDAGTFMYNLSTKDSVRYVRLYMTGKDALASFAEIYVYGQEMALPLPPTARPATNISHEGFTASWSLGSGATGYKLSITTDSDFTEYVLGYKNLNVGDAHTYDVTGLSPTTTYYYRVSSYNIIGQGINSNMISLTTTQAPQTITFDSLMAYSYGDADFDLDAVASSGLPVSYTNTDETVASITGTTVTIHKLGTTTITASQEGDSQYLPASPVVWDLVVNKRVLTVSGAVAADKVYDGTDAATISGASLTGVVDSEDVSLADDTIGTFAQIGGGAGIAVSTSMSLIGQDIDNYELSDPSDLTADIMTKDLTVTADDKEREACASNPEFTITYSEFVGAEDASDLDSEPVVSCLADETSAAGPYDITVSDGVSSNYNFIYVNGTLTISPDMTDPELTVQDINVQLNEAGFAIIYPADVVTSASDNCSLKDTTLSQDLFTGDDIGDVSIDVTVKDMAGNTSTKTAVVTVGWTTGIADQAGSTVRFYPNPANDHITLETGDSGLDIVEITSLNGQLIYSSKLEGSSHKIDLSSFEKGAYFITVKSKDKVITEKIIKR